MTVVRFFYNLLFPLVLAIMLPNFVFRMIRRGKYRHKFGQRFGIYSPRVRQKLAAGTWTWVHAVSVGEVLIALKLIREMKSRDPALQVVLSTTTSTGYALAARERSNWLEPIYNPLDFFWIVRRAIRVIRPRRLILVEAEVWPNLTAQARAQGAKLALVNARLSGRSEKRYRLVRSLVAPLFNQLDLLCVQDPDDAARWESLGVKPGKILCTGSIKFDDAGDTGRTRQDFAPELLKLGVAEHSPILLAGSTHAGEEKLFGEIVLRLKRAFPGLFYVTVPRHAERGRTVQEELLNLGLRTALRSGGGPMTHGVDALVVNTTGELRDWYDCATVVFVGKSLLSHGGQNPAEAVAAGKAVVVGPNMENFKALMHQLLRGRGIIQVPDAAELENTLAELLADPQKRAGLAARGAQCLSIHRGATLRTCEALEKL